MKNNILGGLVIFFVVVACLLMIDDISSTNEEQVRYQTAEVIQQPDEDTNQTDLAVTDTEDEE